jgi:DNA-binding GntR family transcriptional regulator
MSTPATPEPLRRPSVVDELADAIRARILSGDLEPGSPLREAELSQSYDVSRHTLRAALRALATEGLVHIVPNRGGTVVRLDPDELAPLFELRTALELEACRLALKRHGGVLPPSVHEALAALTRVCSAGGADWRDVAEAHARFHEAIVSASESPRIEEAYRRLATELSLFLAQLRPVWPLRRMIDHHRSLVRDLEATGDLEVLRRHLADGLDAVTASGRPSA